MARTPNPKSDFACPVEGVGDFVFGKRTVRDQFSIEAEFSRLTEGLEAVPNFFGRLASASADLKVMTVEAPKDWDIDAMDGEDTDSYVKIMKVWGAYRDKVESFRKKPESAGEGEGQKN